ncbi:MAG: pantoate--beta-alanine ligase [Gemmatimonadetes bacterium]|nr:MAG: pantoate--beta-alanine ligase [Gemmatimonadota bacterium]
MTIIETISEMQHYADHWRQQGKTIGFVPTMGYLHEGHLSLMRLAKTRADVLVVSIYVNPTQFGANEDLDTYPRDLARDQRLLESVECDVLFLPNDAIMYPPEYRTYVTVEELTENLCGTSRPRHFRGVTTIVTKLFHCVKPHVAVFGQKDAQQALIIKRMTADLNMDVEIIIGEIVREADGVAMSSRNVYLSPAEREDARVLSQSLQKAQEAIAQGERSTATLIEMIRTMIAQKPTTTIDYVSIVETKTLHDVAQIEGEVLIALAVFVGKTRLIDNALIRV